MFYAHIRKSVIIQHVNGLKDIIESRIRKKIEEVKKRPIVYVIMLIISILLNVRSNQGYDIGSIVINISMFAIVGAIFAWAINGPLRKVNRLSRELVVATEEIKLEFGNRGSLLWEQYKKDDSNGLFKEGVLSDIYHEYLDEMKRLEEASSIGYRCSIEDYINHEMIDAYAEKNLLNLIPGAMTGLGILGTFIGLSLGLQRFNTGTSAEIEESIAPLMNGIKIAFHTSIYGLVFSLFFNFIYKNLLEELLKVCGAEVIHCNELPMPGTLSSNKYANYHDAALMDIEEKIRVNRQ